MTPTFERGDRVVAITSGAAYYKGDTGTVQERSIMPIVKWDFRDMSAASQERLQLIPKINNTYKIF